MKGAIIDGRYQIVEAIGAGGMGAVYRARQLRIDRDVAVKLLRAGLADPEAARRFETEARAISQLRHPNTLKLIDFGTAEDGRPFLVTEFLSGRSLAAEIGEHPLDAARTIWLVRAICESLIEAHERGIIHRDLKPSNVFIERVGSLEVVKVLDFGIAKMVDGPEVTASGVVLGTPHYMSPEQARGEVLDPRSDLYTLGIVAFECLSGRVPFEGETSQQIMIKHMVERPPKFEDLVPPVSVPPPLAQLVARMLAKHPDDRHESAAELMEELDAIADAVGPPTADITTTRKRVLEVSIVGDTPVLSVEDQARLEQDGIRLSEGRDAELTVVVASEDELSRWRADELPAKTMFAIDAHWEQIPPATVRNHSVLLGPLPLDVAPLSAALRWMNRPSSSLMQGLGAAVSTAVVRDSALKSDSLNMLVSELEKKDLPAHVSRAARAIADELLMNAFFHAPVDEVGRQLHAHQDRSTAIALGVGQEAKLRWAVLDDFVAVSVLDPFGSLEPAGVLESVGSGGMQRKKPSRGAGLGLRTAVQHSAYLIVGVVWRRSSEILALISPVPRSMRRRSALWLLQARSAGISTDRASRRLGDQLWMQRYSDESLDQIELEGQINETSDLGPLFEGGHPIVIDLGAVQSINSVGVLKWMETWARWRSTAKVQLARCSPAIVEQIIAVDRFADGMEIVSVLAPYLCQKCRAERLELVSRDNHGQQPATLPCACGADLRLEEHPQIYFSMWS